MTAQLGTQTGKRKSNSRDATGGDATCDIPRGSCSFLLACLSSVRWCGTATLGFFLKAIGESTTQSARISASRNGYGHATKLTIYLRSSGSEGVHVEVLGTSPLTTDGQLLDTGKVRNDSGGLFDKLVSLGGRRLKSKHTLVTEHIPRRNRLSEGGEGRRAKHQTVLGIFYRAGAPPEMHKYKSRPSAQPGQTTSTVPRSWGGGRRGTRGCAQTH